MNTLDKKGFLYTKMCRYRLKYTLICLLCAVLFAVYTASCADYLAARALGPSKLDAERFAAESSTMVLDGSYSYDPASPEAKIFGYAMPHKSYYQGRSYRFDATVEQVISADVAYTMSGAVVTPEVDTEADPVAVKVDYAVIGGLKLPVMMLSNQSISPGDTITGIFVESSPLILAQLAEKSGGSSTELSIYTLDIRGIDMSSEFSDTLLWVVSLIILLFLVTKLIIYYAKPHKHPMFAQLDKYGDIYAIAAEIEHELKSDKTTFYKNEIYTPEWLLTRQSFKYKIGKNHTAPGKFRYTP